MIFTEKNSIQDTVVRYLFSGPKTTRDVLDYVKSEIGLKTTNQGIYKALRQLRETEVVNIQKSIVELHQRWIVDLQKALEGLQSQNHQQEKTYANLREGERIVYSLKSASDANYLWSHIFGVLLEKMEDGYSVFTYVPHDWFILARYESEKWQIEKAHELRHPYLATVGNNTALDVYAKKLNKSLPGIQANNHNKPLFDKKEYYLNIFGDIVLEVYIDTKTAQRIHSFFMSHDSWNEASKQELENILQERSRSRIVVSHNAKKASKLKKRLVKDFVVSRK